MWVIQRSAPDPIVRLTNHMEIIPTSKAHKLLRDIMAIIYKVSYLVKYLQGKISFQIQELLDILAR